MKRSRITESQIIKILTEQDKGKTVLEICREHNISQPTFYQWKNKYSGMDINQLKQMKDMEKELAQ
jgi:putative transposase